eukprot:13520025-Heterocapsa_arctica.AAC.1
MGVMIKCKLHEYSRTAEAREHLNRKTTVDILALRKTAVEDELLFATNVNMNNCLKKPWFHNVCGRCVSIHPVAESISPRQRLYRPPC